MGGLRTLIFAAVVSYLLTGVAPRAALAAGDDSYVLGHGDVIEISVWREPEMQKQTVIRPDGMVSFPLVGDMEAAGKHVADLKGDIEAALDKYIPDAVVSVAVLTTTSMQVSVQGRVSRPGNFSITGTSTFLEIMAQAGGPTPFAHTRKMKLKRDGEWRRVDYKKTVRGEEGHEDFVLQRGDVIYVP